MSAPPTLNSSWAALSRPPIAPTSVGACGVSCRADARPMGGRVKPGHDVLSFIFNHIKIYDVIVFLFQNSYPYWADDLERQHAPDLSRHRGGARAAHKIAEQFYCRGTGSRQSQGRRRTSGQHERIPPRSGHRRVAHARGRSSTIQQGRAPVARDHRRDARGRYRSERSRRIPALDCSASRTAFVCGGAR